MAMMGMLGIALALSPAPAGHAPAQPPLARMQPGAIAPPSRSPAAPGAVKAVTGPVPAGSLPGIALPVPLSGSAETPATPMPGLGLPAPEGVVPRSLPGNVIPVLPAEKEEPKADWEGDHEGCDEPGDWNWDILPYPYEVPKLPPRMLEEDPEIRALVDDLDDYRRRFYRNELPIRYGARAKIVRKEMGQPDIRSYPDAVGRRVWWYGDSFVVVKDQRVIAWRENCTPLAFGLDVAPRHYLPRRAYRDLPPDDQGETILAPGALGAPGAAAAEAAVAARSALTQARDAYLSALRVLAANPTDINSRLDAIQKGNAYYAALRGGVVTPEDQFQIDRDINSAITSGQLGGP